MTEGTRESRDCRFLIESKLERIERPLNRLATSEMKEDVRWPGRAFLRNEGRACRRPLLLLTSLRREAGSKLAFTRIPALIVSVKLCCCGFIPDITVDI